MKDTMRSKLTQLVRRLEEIDQNLQDPDVTSNICLLYTSDAADE